MTPELRRPVPLELIGAGGLTIEVEASPPECAALADRLAIPAVASLRCTWTVEPAPGGTVWASGRLRARVTQVCVVSLEEFETGVEEAFALRFVPAGLETDDPDPEAPDEIAFEGNAIDLGEASAEQLALALDAYPRAPDAALPEEAASATPSSHPFAALAARRARLD